jgi:hypothetical protein
MFYFEHDTARIQFLGAFSAIAFFEGTHVRPHGGHDQPEIGANDCDGRRKG